MTEHSALPWTWHAKSKDQAHNGSIYRMERPGHAYAIAMQPQYVEDKQFNADAALIVKAVNNHDALVSALQNARNYIDAVVVNTPDKKKRRNYSECLRIIEAALKPVGGNEFATDLISRGNT